MIDEGVSLSPGFDKSIEYAPDSLSRAERNTKEARLNIWSLSSAGSERTPHKRKVTGSIPVAPTQTMKPDDLLIGLRLVVARPLGRGPTAFVPR